MTSFLIPCTEFTHSYDNCSKTKATENNYRVYFVVLCTLGNPSGERFTGWEVPLGCCQLNTGVQWICMCLIYRPHFGVGSGPASSRLSTRRGYILSSCKAAWKFLCRVLCLPAESWVPTNATLFAGCFLALYQYLTRIWNFIKWYSGSCQSDKIRRIT